MSYADHTAARRVKGLRGTTQAVFYEIAFRTSNNDDLHECSVKVSTLADALGKTDQPIRLAIKELRGVNLIQTTRRPRKDGTLSCFRFKLTMPFPHTVIVPKRAPRKPRPAVISTGQPAVISTAPLSESSLDQGFIQKIEAAATPGLFPSIQVPEAEKTADQIQSGIEPPIFAHPPHRYHRQPLPQDTDD